MRHKYVHRQQCAAVVNGCKSVLIWESDRLDDVERHLLLNGWREAEPGDIWLCKNH